LCLTGVSFCDLTYSSNLNCCRSPIEADASSDSIAPFDLTPQTELVLSDNFSERKILVQVR